jgi:lipopolysaccharide biosynthesis regulator YciM
MTIPFGAFNKKESTEEEKKAAEDRRRLEELRSKQLKIERPHTCTWCGNSAYVGYAKIECSNPSCLKYVPFEWTPPEEKDGCNDKDI